MTLKPPTPTTPADTSKKARRIVWILMAMIVAAGLIWYAVFTFTKPAPQVTTPADGGQLVRGDSHRVTKPVKEQGQLVEFLDFECEACGSIQPFVNELKQEFGDKITFVTRYFPLPSHRNSKTAALAAEAAAQQGKYEQMYNKLFETQTQWGEKQESEAALFRTFAQEMGLNMTAYDAAVADDKTKARILKDVADGTALGVTGTPTFFLDGKKLTLTTKEALRQALADTAK
ncbi:DsbA family protein [Arthrobacter cryoconiti]|uniref:DsbA family protein n=1 Tax=Arthrobacter cryoconiti TaxID=748907 RepID=A0ABV8R6W6_9MICC|nr:thioredoxin domain-containing protein [Arthrobacter cryoconiti]MCC9069429.1 thioredoxin domain-containing protein [Arthrobacter cryoconiti]